MKDYYIFSVFLFLLRKRSTTARQIAEELEISSRTVYRYIDALSLIGVPIITKLGRSGGIELIGEFKIDSMLLSESDKQIIENRINEGNVDKELSAVLKKIL